MSILILKSLKYLLQIIENLLLYFKRLKCMSQQKDSPQRFKTLKYSHQQLKKFSNFIVDVKIADFGLARVVSYPSQKYTRQVVTLYYRAPELILGSPTYTSAIDIWSAGCIFAQLFTHHKLFHGDSQIDQLYQIFRLMGTPNKKIWPDITQCQYYRLNFPSWNKKDLRQIISQLKFDDQAYDLLMVFCIIRKCLNIILMRD